MLREGPWRARKASGEEARAGSAQGGGNWGGPGAVSTRPPGRARRRGDRRADQALAASPPGRRRARPARLSSIRAASTDAVGASAARANSSTGVGVTESRRRTAETSSAAASSVSPSSPRSSRGGGWARGGAGPMAGGEARTRRMSSASSTRTAPWRSRALQPRALAARRTRDGEDLATLLAGQARGDQGARAQFGLHDHHP